MYKKCLIALAVCSLITPLAFAKSNSTSHKKNKRWAAYHTRFKPYWSFGAALAYTDRGAQILTGAAPNRGVSVSTVSGSAWGGQIFAEYAFRPHFSISPYLMKAQSGTETAIDTNNNKVDTAKISTFTIGLLINAKINIIPRLFASAGFGPCINFNHISAANLANFQTSAGGTSTSAAQASLAGEFKMGYKLNSATLSIAYMMPHTVDTAVVNIGGGDNGAKRLSPANVWLFGISYTPK